MSEMNHLNKNEKSRVHFKVMMDVVHIIKYSDDQNDTLHAVKYRIADMFKKRQSFKKLPKLIISGKIGLDEVDETSWSMFLSKILIFFLLENIIQHLISLKISLKGILRF